MPDKSPSNASPVVGRDELNLADFPISVLQRQQPVRSDGERLDTVTFEATRYDPTSGKRVPQRVTLTTSSRFGLPTPADENVILGLLYLAKQQSNFGSPTVHFCPYRLFKTIRWAPNSRSYQRLQSVLRRLKALTILYENAWWDADGKQFAQEFATGIVSEYQIRTPSRGRMKADQTPSCWITWSPTFFQSLNHGNLKKLDLDQLFRLRLPTSQRIYRFLDKRFYADASIAMDLVEFACGHIGLQRVDNVGILKQRLAPALRELEGIQFLKPESPDSPRYRKHSPGIWRIQLQKAPTNSLPKTEPACLPADESIEPSKSGTNAVAIVREFHRLRFGIQGYTPLAKEIAYAQSLLDKHGIESIQRLVPKLAETLKSTWPEGRTFLAIKAYVDVAMQADVRREKLRRDEQEKEEAERQVILRKEALRQRMLSRWNALSEEGRDKIREQVVRKFPFVAKHAGIIERFCLLELERQTLGDPAA